MSDREASGMTPGFLLRATSRAEALIIVLEKIVGGRVLGGAKEEFL